MKLGILLPHLRTGGIERNMVTLATLLRDHDITTTFYLQSAEGDLLAPAQQTAKVIDLAAPGVRAAKRAVAAALRNNCEDVVYAATNALNIALMGAHRSLGRDAPAVVLGEHIPLNAFLDTRKQPWLRRLMIKRLYPRAAQIVAPCQPILAEHQALIGRRCPPVTMLPNPVVAQVIESLPTLAPKATKLVTLGRLSVEKGMDLALQVMAQLRQKHPDMHLRIYGEGPERPQLETLHKNLNLSDTVTFTGRTATPLAAIAEADMLICTSKVEGFGNTLVEAQSCGVPVFSVDCPFGPAQILEQGRAGRLVNSRDPATLADALADFANDKTARDAARSAGRDVAAQFTQAASAQAHADLFHRLAAGV